MERRDRMAETDALSARAVRAAGAVGREQGIRCAEPVVLRDLTNVLVHLAFAPVVARVPVTLARLRGLDWNRRVLELAAGPRRARRTRRAVGAGARPRAEARRRVARARAYAREM
jgi:hypothetical protein